MVRDMIVELPSILGSGGAWRIGCLGRKKRGSIGQDLEGGGIEMLQRRIDRDMRLALLALQVGHDDDVCLCLSLKGDELWLGKEILA